MLGRHRGQNRAGGSGLQDHDCATGDFSSYLTLSH